MDIEKLFDRLTFHIPNDMILRNEIMKNHTSFKIGGPADILLFASDIQQIRTAVSECRDLGVPYYVIGNGSNLLIRDNGFRGLIIKVCDCFNKFSINNTKIWAQAGASLSMVAKAAIDAELSGLEFAVEIPGTIGGAAAMNAGAYTGEMKDVIQSVLILDAEGNVSKLNSEEIGFSYRNSLIQERGLIILEAFMELTRGDKIASKALSDEYTALRQKKQPFSFPSAGSVFKRPPGNYAGRLVDEAGLRGFRVGDAQISDLHCGFIINLGNASAKDVISLIKIVEGKVKEKTGIDMILEIKIIGE